MRLRVAALACASALLACATVEQSLGVRGGAYISHELTTSDGARVRFHRLTPTSAEAPRVFIVPELGFAWTAFRPLAERLRARGFDVATLEGRHLVDSRATASFRTWTVDVARAVRQHGPPVRVLAIGVGGEAAFTLARVGGVRGIVAVNVPLQHGVDNVALADALAASYFNPHDWFVADRAAVLLGCGRMTPRDSLDRLRYAARPLPVSLSRDLALRIVGGNAVTLPPVPVRVLASFKDNLVAPERAVGSGVPKLASARRMARIESFDRDYGHLDWLADAAALRDVVPVIAEELEALP